MSKELEALEFVGRTFVSVNSGIALNECNKYTTIEQALKDKEKLDKFVEIIRNKWVEIGILMVSGSAETYNHYTNYEKIDQCEYVLLREILKKEEKSNE